ncbi:MAG: FtsW/RodA/SpoVE family cell cycle protein, partial [Albidovulum sp.]|nr:FtsW/RodA/SpoVE family cell cycle protein [Albidovulum sp.]
VLFLLALLGVLLLPFFGVNHGKGAVRWLSLPGLMTFHPSEFLKPGFVVVVAWLLALKDDAGKFPGTMISLGLTVSIATLLALQPDFGQAGLIIFAWGVIYFVAGASILLLFALGAGTVLAGTVAFFTSSHFSSRILAFISDTPDPYSQIQFSLKAIQAGGLFGVGLGKGEVKWVLADSHTDLVMAVAAEEYGLIFVLLLLSLFAFISIRALFVLRKEQDKFIRLAGTGLAAMFGIQAFINIGVTAKLLPAKGMTLPFISYGGSSMIAVGLGLGMLLAYTRRRSNNQLGTKV